MERIITAFVKAELRQKIVRLLASEGWETEICSSGAEVIRTVRQTGTAVVICGFQLPDMTADSLAGDLRGLAAVMVVAKAAMLELCGGENLFKLPVPASRSEFLAALRLLTDFKAARLNHPKSRRPEEEQQLIRRAKELLMDVNRMTEEEAHRFLQKRSMERGVRLIESARWVIASYTL